MKIERENFLHAKFYERTPERIDRANGYKPRTLQTRNGKMKLEVPQTRDTPFYPSCLEKGLRSERTINAAIAEMYIQGVATRNIKNILTKMCGLDVSASQVSRTTKQLDDKLEIGHNHPLKEAVSYLLLDDRYEKVRTDGCVIDCALFTAYGVTEDGHRRVLGTDVSLSEDKVHWRHFLTSLSERGHHG